MKPKQLRQLVREECGVAINRFLAAAIGGVSIAYCIAFVVIWVIL